MTKSTIHTVKSFISAHKYKGIKVGKQVFGKTMSVSSKSELPIALSIYIKSNFNVVFCSTTYIEFTNVVNITDEYLKS